jgi:hypothetical protein
MGRCPAVGSAIALGVILFFLVVFLIGLLSSLDREAMRSTPRGSLSERGVRAVVGGGFMVGLAYGVLVGIQSGAETWYWLSRGVVDGLVVACAGAFYVGYQQRRRRAREGRSAIATPDDHATPVDAAPDDAAPSADGADAIAEAGDPVPQDPDGPHE